MTPKAHFLEFIFMWFFLSMSKLHSNRSHATWSGTCILIWLYPSDRRINQLVYSREWKVVFQASFIQAREVYAHLPFTTAFHNNYNV